MGSAQVNTEVGIGLRQDLTQNSELSHTINRFTLLDRVMYGNITETNLAAYVNEHIKLNEKLNKKSNEKI